MNYEQAAERLGKRPSRKVGNNTYLQRRDDETIALKLHDTDIVTFRPGRITLDSGGWRTVTTKARMNDYIPGRIAQERRVWYYSPDGWQTQVAYDDGMTIYDDGRIEGAGPDPKIQLKLQKRVKAYGKGFIAAMRAGKVSKPDSGDCWYCLFRSDDGKTWGENSRDTSHILSHLDDAYYVPSLLVRALEVFGASQAMNWALGEVWFPEQLNGNKPYWSKQDYLWKQVESMLNRYVCRQLNMAA